MKIFFVLLLIIPINSCKQEIDYTSIYVVEDIIEDYSADKISTGKSSNNLLNFNISTAKIIEEKLMEKSLDSLINLLIVNKKINLFLFLAKYMESNSQVLIIDKLRSNRNFNIFSNFNYANLVDKYNLNIKNVQKYGTINTKTKILNFDSIFYDSIVFEGKIDLNLININRSHLGLFPLNLTENKPIYSIDKALPSLSDLQRYILPDLSTNQADSFIYLFLGKKGIPFNMRDISGNLIKFDTSVNRITLMEFWFTSCPPCMTEIQVLNLVYEYFKFNPNVLIVSICRDSPDEIMSFLKNHRVLYPIISDHNAYMDNYLLKGFPLTILFNNSLLITNIESGSSVEIDQLFIRNKANKYINLINDYLTLQK